MGQAGTNLVKLSLALPRLKCKHDSTRYGPGRYEFSETVPGFTAKHGSTEIWAGPVVSLAIPRLKCKQIIF